MGAEGEGGRERGRKSEKRKEREGSCAVLQHQWEQRARKREGELLCCPATPSALKERKQLPLDITQGRALLLSWLLFFSSFPLFPRPSLMQMGFLKDVKLKEELYEFLSLSLSAAGTGWLE